MRSADPGSLAAFCGVCAIVTALAGVALWRASRRAAIAAAGFVAVFCAVVAIAPVATSPLPWFPLLFGSVVVFPFAVSLSPVGRAIARDTPLFALVGFQAFRIPLELVLHYWGERGTIPTTMTWSGQNLDVIAGVVALVAIPLVRRRPTTAWVPTIIGLVSLINVARVALMSAPLPFAWHVEPPLVLLAYLPYALIGPLCVAPALAGHLIAIRALRGR